MTIKEFEKEINHAFDKCQENDKISYLEKKAKETGKELKDVKHTDIAELW